MFNNKLLISDTPFSWHTGTSGSGALSFTDMHICEIKDLIGSLPSESLFNGVFDPDTAEAIGKKLGVDMPRLQLASPSEVSFANYDTIVFVYGAGAQLKFVKVTIEFMG